MSTYETKEEWLFCPNCNTDRIHNSKYRIVSGGPLTELRRFRAASPCKVCGELNPTTQKKVG